MPPVFKIFFLDGVSKCVLALTTFAIIRVLAVDQYALFTLVFTSVLMAYQTLCGLIERMYISDSAGYAANGSSAFILAWGSTLLVLGVYLSTRMPSDLAAVGMLVFIICTYYQFQRIKLQRGARFFSFMMIDFGRNIVWLGLLALLAWWHMVSAMALIAAYGISAVVMAAFYRAETVQAAGLDGPVFDWRGGALYLFERRALVGYCALAGLTPYLCLLMISREGSSYLTASYGAALRYQSIFAMAVYALNSVLIVRFTGGEQEVSAMISAFYKRLPLLLGCLVALTAAVAWLIPLIDQGKYGNAPILFVLLAGCSAASLVASPSVNYLLSRRHYGLMLRSITFGVLVMLGLGSLFNQVNGSYGVMAAVFLGYLMVAVMNIHSCRRMLRCA